MTEQIINELIESCIATISKHDNNYETVGNRMHFPVFVTFNGLGKDELFQTMNNEFKKIWPETAKLVNIFNAVSTENGYSFYSCDEKDISVDSIQQRYLKKSKQSSDSFASLSRWNYYNILNTEWIDTFADFEKYYNLVDYVNDSVVFEHTKSMLILTLDDSAYLPEKKELVAKIKAFVKEAAKDGTLRYNGIIILSNKSNSGQEFSFEKEVISVITSAIIVSSNDAVKTDDDASYGAINSLMYSGAPLTIAQCKKKKPYKDISLFLIRELMEQVSVIASQEEIHSENIKVDWESVLDIKDGKIVSFDKFFRGKINMTIDYDTLSHMPFKIIPPNGFNIANENISTILRYVVEDSLNDYIWCLTQYCISADDIEAFFKEFEKRMFSLVSTADFYNLDARSISDILGKIADKEPAKNCTIDKYMQEYALYTAYQTIVIPRIEKIMFSIKESTQDLKRKFTEFKDSFISHFPVSGFDHLGNKYKNAIEDFKKSGEGSRSIKYVFRPGNDEKEFAEQISCCVKEIVAANSSLFNLSFLQHWTMMLQGSGEDLYATLNNEFGRAFSDRVFYSTNYNFPAGSMDIYMFHTHTGNDGNGTNLYKYLSANSAVNSTVCYINTGRDSSIEALRIYKISGDFD